MWFSMAMLVITRWYMEIPISKPTITGPWQWHEGWNPQRTRSTWGKVTEIAIWDWYSSWKDGDQQHWTGFTWDDDHTSWGPRRLRLCGDQSRLVHEQGDFRPPRWVQKKRLVLDLGCALRQRSAARCKKTGCQFLKLRPNNQALQERQLADLLYRDKPTVHNAAGRMRQAVDDFSRRLGPY